MSELSSPLKCITALDALRGFALFGIIVMYMLQHFGYGFVPTTEEILNFSHLDAAMQWIGDNIAMGRFINIFAFLFGMSLFIQIDKAAKKGVYFRYRFIWRMILLMLFGLLCHSFYNVEIISVYAFFGLLLLALYRVKTWILVIISIVLLLGVPRVAQVHFHNQQVAADLDLSIQLVNIEQQTNRVQPEHNFVCTLGIWFYLWLMGAFRSDYSRITHLYIPGRI